MDNYGPPGTVSQWRSLQAMLREAHEHAAQSIKDAIAKRIAAGIPLDNTHADWKATAKALTQEAFSEGDRAKSRQLIRNALAVADGGLREPAPYAPAEEIEGIEVKLRALRARDVAQMRATFAAIEYRGTDFSSVDAWRSDAAAYEAARSFLLLAVAGIRGHCDAFGSPVPEAEGDAIGGALDVLEVNGALLHLLAAAKEFQSLSPLRRRDYGSLRPSISEISTAAPALPPSGSDSDATPTSQAHHTLQAQTLRHADVLSPTFATMSLSPMLSAPTAPVEVLQV